MEKENTASSFIWALALIIIVAIIAGTLYYSGFLSGSSKKKHEIDIKIEAPASR